MQPPNLKEICFWKLQKPFVLKDYHSGMYKGGKSEKELRILLGINYNKSFI